MEQNIKNRLGELIDSGNKLMQGDEYGRANDQYHQHGCVGWLASAQNVLNLVVGNPKSPYRKSADKEFNSTTNDYAASVGRVTKIMEALLKDIEWGLLTSIENQARATVFDDFLDHAKECVKSMEHKQAGVISGVVFEDTLRTICRNQGIDEKGEPLEKLINQLVKNDTLSPLKAKRAKVASGVRTKATHAQWDEYDLKDVEATIDFTEELIKDHLDK